MSKGGFSYSWRNTQLSKSYRSYTYKPSFSISKLPSSPQEKFDPSITFVDCTFVNSDPKIEENTFSKILSLYFKSPVYQSGWSLSSDEMVEFFDTIETLLQNLQEVNHVQADILLEKFKNLDFKNTYLNFRERYIEAYSNFTINSNSANKDTCLAVYEEGKNLSNQLSKFVKWLDLVLIAYRDDIPPYYIDKGEKDEDR